MAIFPINNFQDISEFHFKIDDIATSFNYPIKCMDMDKPSLWRLIELYKLWQIKLNSYFEESG